MIGAVENALVQVLESAGDQDVLGYRYRTLDSYPDDFDAYLKEKGQLRTPAAWAVFLGLDQGSDNKDGSGWNGRGRFALVVAAQNLRNETATRQGGPDRASEPGSYQLAIDATRLLSRNALEPLDLVSPVEVNGMRLVARTKEMRDQLLSLMAIDLSCELAFGNFTDGEMGDFAQMHVDWDVPELGNVEPPLPAANPDAEDLIEVPQ